MNKQIRYLRIGCIMAMKKILYNMKYSGILWAIVVASTFVAISFSVRSLFSGASWFVFSSVLRFVFGFFILFIVKKLYGTPIKKVLSVKGSKTAIIAGSFYNRLQQAFMKNLIIVC